MSIETNQKIRAAAPLTKQGLGSKMGRVDLTGVGPERFQGTKRKPTYYFMSWKTASYMVVFYCWGGRQEQEQVGYGVRRPIAIVKF